MVIHWSSFCKWILVPRAWMYRTQMWIRELLLFLCILDITRHPPPPSSYLFPQLDEALGVTVLWSPQLLAPASCFLSHLPWCGNQPHSSFRGTLIMASILWGLQTSLKILRSKESSVLCQAHLFVLCLLSHPDSSLTSPKSLLFILASHTCFLFSVHCVHSWYLHRLLHLPVTLSIPITWWSPLYLSLTSQLDITTSGMSHSSHRLPYRVPA